MYDWVNSSSHSRGGTGARGREDLNGDDVRLLGDAVSERGDGAGAVSAVAVTIGSLANERGTPLGASTELDVGGENTGVEDIDIDTSTGSIIVSVRERSAGSVLVAQSSSLCDTLQAPGRVGPWMWVSGRCRGESNHSLLGCEGVEDGVLSNSLDLI